MSLTITQLRLLVLSKRRYFTDAVAWFMLYLLLALIVPILLWHQFDLDRISKDNEFNYFVPYVLDYRVKFQEPGNISIRPLEDIPASSTVAVFRILIKDMIWFGLWLIPVVYINLLVLKEYVLDYEPPRKWKNPLYLIGLLALSALFAALMYYADKYGLSWVRTRLKRGPLLIINFGIALISTGLLYRKELFDKRNIEEELASQLKKANEKIEKAEMAVTNDHLKIGTKNNYDIIRFEEIVYVKANNNGSMIYTLNDKYECGNKMMDYQKLLPENDFIRTHKSYIVSKRKVIKREGDIFILSNGKGKKYKVFISDSYRKKIEEDDYLGRPKKG